MSFYLATATVEGLEEVSTCDYPDNYKMSVPTVRDGSVSKKDFFKRLSKAELNEFKAMAFDVLMKETKDSDDEYVCFLRSLVGDVIRDKNPFFWPSRIVETESKKVEEITEPELKKARNVGIKD